MRENDRNHAEPDIVEPEGKEEENIYAETHRIQKETDTNSQYINYSYTYNPICLRCKMHRFCPRDRVYLSYRESLEERVIASEGRPPPPPSHPAPSAPIVGRSSSSIYRNRASSVIAIRIRLARLSIRRGSSLPGFNCRGGIPCLYCLPRLAESILCFST